MLERHPHHHHPPLVPLRVYLLRIARAGSMGGGLVLGSLAIGMLGYHSIEKLSWVDALLNAAMILTGMGPVNEMKTTAGKLFASAYALFSGVAFLTIVAVVFAPVVHRFLHRFHLELEHGAEENGGGGA